jgi:hypothetical protein
LGAFAFLDVILDSWPWLFELGNRRTVVAIVIFTDFQLRIVINHNCRVSPNNRREMEAMESPSTSASGFLYLGRCFYREFGDAGV